MSVAKRNLMMVVARNLSTIMRAIIGIGAPRRLQGFGAMLQTAWIHLEWLLAAADWPIGAAAPAKFFFANLPETTSKKDLLKMVKNRWWVEHSYKELKDEIALDHFERRSWRGWHHHVTLTLLAYAFLVEIRRKKGIPA